MSIEIEPLVAKTGIWSGYKGLLIRPDKGPGSTREAISGAFSLILHWASGTKISRDTYNARTVTVVAGPASGRPGSWASIA